PAASRAGTPWITSSPAMRPTCSAILLPRCYPKEPREALRPDRGPWSLTGRESPRRSEGSSMADYSPPVDRLLKIGECKLQDWPDYLAFGLGPEHVPDLIRMVEDEELNEAPSESLRVWAPIHAWRAL